MSLEEKPTEQPPEKEKKKTKKTRAREKALQYKDLTDDQARTKIMEEVPCSRSTASKAVTWLRKKQEEEKGEKPSLKVVPEEEKKPKFLGEEERPVEEIKKEERPIEEITLTPEEAQEQLDLFKDMLRGMHLLLISKDGLLGEKYGRPEKQCVQASDQLYRWLCRRYGVEDLERWDTILLVMSYGTLVGGIVKEVIAERRKKKSKK